MKKKEKWSNPSVIKEDQSKTTENSKHFIFNNATRKSIFYPSNINYFDSNEKVWKPVESSLKSAEDHYYASLGKYTAKLSKKSENETVEVGNDDGKISWEYLGINKNVFLGFKQSNITKRKSKLNVCTECNDSLGLSCKSRAIYSGAEGNIDLDYTIEGNGVKENIIINEKADSYHYYFLLRISGFEIKPSSDGLGLEFHKPNTNAEITELHTPEFIMPAPFMYDANGEQSKDVKYAIEKIDDNTFIFSIEANPEWINANERVFPVCIDPQLLTVTSNSISVTHNSYQWVDCSCCSSCTCYDSYWKYMGNPYYPYVYLNNTASSKITAKLNIKKSKIDLAKNKFISAKLIFEQYSGQTYYTSAQVKINNSYYTHYNGNSITADISSLYTASSGDFTIDLSMVSANASRKFNIPTLEIEYQPISADPIRKTFDIESNVSAELDILSGNTSVIFDDITDPVLGASVSHVYKPNNTFEEYGKNFRLNLDEKLVKTSTTSTGAQYTYTDPLGDVHTFKEHFYKIGSNGEKVYITSGISSITADAEGRLWSGGNEIFRELKTDKGLRASSRLEGVVNNAEWVEQRLDEEKQAEEQVKSYKNTLCNFVSVNKETGAISPNRYESMLSSPDSVESFLNEIGCASHLLLSKEEALSYKSLLTQKESLETSKAALKLQKESLKNNAKSLLYQHDATETFEYQRNSHDVQYKSLQYEKEGLNYAKSDYKKSCAERGETEDQSRINYYDNQIAFIGIGSNANDTKAKLLSENLTLINEQEVDWAIQKEHIKNQIRNFPGIDAPSGSSNGTLTKQYANTKEQINSIDKQIEDLDAQISLYADKSAKYIPQFKSYYKEYLNLKNQLDKLKLQIPVSYLISDSAVKGFNSKGDLVIIQDKYGKYVVVEREKYNTSGKTRISAVYDQDSRAMTFSYNEKNKLSSICNTLGERVAFQYDTSGYLTAIKPDNQPTLTISYKTVSEIYRVHKITSSNNTQEELNYNNSAMLTGITRKTSFTDISHDNVTTSSYSEISTFGVEYTSTYTKLTYDGIKQEIYTVDPDEEQITAHYELINGLVTGAEFYTYSDYLITKTERAGKSCLNRYSYADFAAQMQIETVEDVTYDSFKEPKSAVISKYALPRSSGDSPIEKNEAEYTYNDDRKLTQKKTTHSYYSGSMASDTTVAIEKYYYNNAGELVRKESYVDGEELKTGINVEEHVFNDKGFEIQSFTYNTLDPSSKFYTENEIDENGMALAAFDESGEHKTAFSYERDGVSVKTEHLPNGSKFSYGRDKDGTVSAITHSTENGEENSTTQLRTLDVVTEIKSGNNTVRYAYDKKRRVKSVSLNGVSNYVTYSYSGDNTNAEKVTATMADGTVVTSTKNAHGNVTKSTVGSRTVNNTYNNDQQLTNTVDSVSGTTTLSYNAKGKLSSVTSPDHTESYTYNSKDILTSKTIDGRTYTFAYKTTADKSLDSITVDGKVVRPATDALGRNTGKTIKVGSTNVAEEKISYVKFGDHATNMPSNVRYATNGVFNESIQYKYDSMGNIIEVLENGRSACRYEYDALGRLTREDNVAFGKTTTWAYDNNGNILAKYEYDITTKATSELHLMSGTCKLYTYDDNSDQLMSYNGESFVYDTIGNPTTYRGKTATWAYGRQLAGYDGNTFTYDARGRRMSKQKEGEAAITFTYDSNGNLIKQSNGLEFLYDHTGVFAVKHNGSTYFYRKDAQANIVALLDNTGAVVVKYKYDAWGKCKVLNADGSEITDSNHIGILNPFRYRSYYYDIGIGLYFLKTRYYDPEIGRFITIDDISYLDPESINGLNLYAYCGNNPVNRVDSEGNFAISTILIGCLIAFAVGATVSTVSQGLQYGWNNISVGQVLVDGLFAAASVALAATGISFIASVGIGAVMGLGQYAIGSAFHGESMTWQGAIIATVMGGIGGAISGAGAKNLKSIASIYDNMTGRAAQGFKALITTAQKYGLGSKQITLVNNLYGKAIQTAVNQGIKKAFIQGAVKINISTPGIALLTPLVNRGVSKIRELYF